MNTKKKNRASLSISKETKGLLDLIKYTGQSYNGLIQELVWLWKKEHRLAESDPTRSETAVERVEEVKKDN